MHKKNYYEGDFLLINYEPFWSTLQSKEITKYQLIYHWGISSNTIRRMRHNEAISSTTLNELCLILDCQIQDIIQFQASDDEKETIETHRKEIKLN